MECSDSRRKRVDSPPVQFAAPGDFYSERILIKATHLQRVFKSNTFRAKPGMQAAAGDGNDAQIHPGGGAPVEAQLFLAAPAPRCERAEIQKSEANRLLDLVGIFAGEKHPGDVGFDHLDSSDRMRIAGRIEQQRRGNDICRYQSTSLTGLRADQRAA